jgi:hypothetical protein
MPPSSLNRSSSSDMKLRATVDCGRLLGFHPKSGSTELCWGDVEDMATVVMVVLERWQW